MNAQNHSHDEFCKPAVTAITNTLVTVGLFNAVLLATLLLWSSLGGIVSAGAGVLAVSAVAALALWIRRHRAAASMLVAVTLSAVVAALFGTAAFCGAVMPAAASSLVEVVTFAFTAVSVFLQCASLGVICTTDVDGWVGAQNSGDRSSGLVIAPVCAMFATGMLINAKLGMACFTGGEPGMEPIGLWFLGVSAGCVAMLGLCINRSPLGHQLMSAMTYGAAIGALIGALVLATNNTIWTNLNVASAIIVGVHCLLAYATVLSARRHDLKAWFDGAEEPGAAWDAAPASVV